MFIAPTTSTQSGVQECNSISRAKWAERIAHAWQKQVLSIFETASLLESAKAELRRGDFMKMVKAELPFSQSTANKLIKIAACGHLHNSEHVPNLPAHWGTLFELTLLTGTQFESGIKTGEINPKMERKAIRALRGDPPKPTKSVKCDLRQENEQLKAETAQLKEHVAELEAARDVNVEPDSVVSLSDELHALFNTACSLMQRESDWPELTASRARKRQKALIVFRRVCGTIFELAQPEKPKQASLSIDDVDSNGIPKFLSRTEPPKRAKQT
jgi:hypothetical protein